MFATVFKRLFTRTKHASDNIVMKKYCEFETRTFNFSNNFIKSMNASNPQETGRLVEHMINEMFIKQMKHIDYIDLNGYSPVLIDILLANIDEYRSFVKQMNNLVLFIINWKSRAPLIPVYLQDNLSFKKVCCCKVKELRCFADVTTIDTIVELKAVRNSFFCLNQINSEIAVKRLNNIGIRYYNQLMTYACGFNKKYGRWPHRLILINAYNGEVINWQPTITDYNEFYDMI